MVWVCKCSFMYRVTGMIGKQIGYKNGKESVMTYLTVSIGSNVTKVS